ncbi:MAG: hypothetical protein CL910_21200 [Deltaproteobacteria bacterium]|jgi:hypothetical protein|nr:hypothetical protein [Deltaproteobacteria bacterium]
MRRFPFRGPKGAAVWLVLLALGLSAGAAHAELQVGFAREVITPPVPDAWTDLDGDGRRSPEEPWQDGNGNGRFDPVHMAGFHNGRPAAGIHDELFAVAVVIDDGTSKVGLVAADVVGLSNGFARELRARLPAELGLDYLLVHATHNHQGPDTQGLWGASRFRSGLAEGTHERLWTRMIAALERAHAAREPARLDAGEVPGMGPRLGLDDTRPPRVIDDALRILVARRADHSVIGTIVNFGVHVEILWDQNLFLTADVAGYAREGISRGLVYDDGLWEPGLGGTTLWLTGNIGGLITTLPSTPVVDPRDGKAVATPSFEKARAQGYAIARAVRRAAEQGRLVPVEDPILGIHRRTVTVPIANLPLVLGSVIGLLDRDLRWARGIATDSEVGLLTLGDVWLAAIPGELYPELAIGGVTQLPGADFELEPAEVPPLRDAMGGRVNLMVNLANDALGYLIPRSHWDDEAPWLEGAEEETYGEIVSAGPETAGIVHRALLELFAEAD